MDLRDLLPLLLPKAIAWIESEEARITASGQALTPALMALAQQVGVERPERIRVELADALLLPADPDLRVAATATGLWGPNAQLTGLTLGHAVFIRRGEECTSLFAHEFRHVHQYEQAGSIAAFLPTYVLQVLRFGYQRAPLEVDACSYESRHP
jgi:hypothetical protein